MSGVLITFEGGEGTGKSTQLLRFVDRLKAADLDVLLLREPGGTRVGEVVRSALLDPAHVEMDPLAELLLYEASRAQLVAEHIRPALAEGVVVVCDRFYDSSTAYQGYGRGLPLNEVRELNRIATGGLVPDLSIVLDLDPAAGLERATRSGADRLEAETIEFHTRLREGYLAIAAAEPERFAVVDALGTVQEVEARIATAAARLPELASAFGDLQ